MNTPAQSVTVQKLATSITLKKMQLYGAMAVDFRAGIPKYFLRVTARSLKCRDCRRLKFLRLLSPESY